MTSDIQQSNRSNSVSAALSKSESISSNPKDSATPKKELEWSAPVTPRNSPSRCSSVEDCDESSELESSVKEKLDEKKEAKEAMVLVEFEWIHTNAEHVLLAESFDDWSTYLHMQRKTSNGHFSAFIPLRRGNYKYKFIVDGQWMVDVMKPTESDGADNVNNIINV